MTFQGIPPEIEEVFREFRTCEYTTISRKGTPVTWPVVLLREKGTGRFIITTSIGLPQKAFNVRRNPKVSLLFSDPTGSGLENPPTVLVQGDAEAPDEITNNFFGYDDQMRVLADRQPDGKLFSGNPVTRYLFDWYYMRLFTYVTPRRVQWWDGGDLTSEPHEVTL